MNTPEYNCFKWCLKNLFTMTSRICSCEAIPLNMTTRSAFTECITDLPSTVKWPFTIILVFCSSEVHSFTSLWFYYGRFCTYTTDYVMEWYIKTLHCLVGLVGNHLLSERQKFLLKFDGSFWRSQVLCSKHNKFLHGLYAYYSLLALNFCRLMSLIMLCETGIPFCL